MSVECIICALVKEKWSAGRAYLLGAAMGMRGIHLGAVGTCEMHAKACRDVYPSGERVADVYEQWIGTGDE